MFCPNCGNQTADDAKFCSKCGNSITQADQRQVSQPVYHEGGRGITVFIFGLLGIVMLGPILGIPAWVMGHNDLKKIRAGIIPQSEEGLTKAGYILGIIASVLWGLLILIVLFSIFLGIFMFREMIESTGREVIYSSIQSIQCLTSVGWFANN
jgi:hypothetical protein